MAVYDDAPLARKAGLDRSSLTRCSTCRLNIFEAQLVLVGIELLGRRAAKVGHKPIDDRLQAYNLCVSPALSDRQVRKFVGPLEGLRT